MQLEDIHPPLQDTAAYELPDVPFIYEENTTLSMHFDMSAIQSVMRKYDPTYLVLGYTRTMMGFLLLHPSPARIGMIGLGGGSLAKYCLKHLPDTHFTAVEINTSVIALRNKFMIPPDDARFRVLHADGADYVTDDTDPLDVLLLDGFNDQGHPERLCTRQFFDHCYAKLRDGGVLASNLLAQDPSSDTYLARLQDSFSGNVLVVEAEGNVNKIAFACKNHALPHTAALLRERLQALTPRHAVALHHTAQKLIGQL